MKNLLTYLLIPSTLCSQGGFMSSTEQQEPPVANSQRLGRPVLTTWDAIAQSLAIGPIFSSAFVAFLIAGSAGGAAPLSTLIGVVGVLALGWLISLYARRGGGAGAIYDYLRRCNPAFGLFETSASLGEETRDPRRSIPRAVIGTVIITGIFYLVVVYASDIGFGLAHSDKWAGNGPGALDFLATKYVGSWLAVLVDIAVLFD